MVLVLFEFLIPERPVSLQTKNSKNYQAWKSYVQIEAAKLWTNPPLSNQNLQLTLVYLSGSDPVDVDNIIKPIQDALVGLIYTDDILITDVESRRRLITGTFDLTRCPKPLLKGITIGSECVYVRIAEQAQLEYML